MRKFYRDVRIYAAVKKSVRRKPLNFTDGACVDLTTQQTCSEQTWREKL